MAYVARVEKALEDINNLI